MAHDWLYDKIQRVPAITDEQIAEMRHIEPVLRDGERQWFRRIKDARKLHPRDVSFLRDAEPTGDDFTFDSLNISQIITQHHSAVFFKPSLAEVYAWIRVYMPETWREVRFFCLRPAERLGGTSDLFCICDVMGGRALVRGPEFIFPSGAVGHELVESEVSV